MINNRIAKKFAASTDWFYEAKYGLFFHYLKDNKNIGSFNVERFADGVAEMGAGYIIFALGQNSGYYCAPNDVYKFYIDAKAGDYTSARDLPMEIAGALSERNIRLMLYLPSNAPGGTEIVKECFGLSMMDPDKNWHATPELMLRWGDVISFWAKCYGKKVSGWWFDGWYNWNGFTDLYAENYTKAVKSGNPDSIVCFNRGVEPSCRKSTVFEDYIAGEREDFDDLPDSRLRDGIQWHILSYLGPGWGAEGLKYSDKDIIAYVKQATDSGGVVSMDMAIHEDGSFDPLQAEQVKKIKSKVRI